MRRVLGAISNKGDVGNIMTLANPEIVDEIKKMRGSETKVKILIESTIYETPAERLKRLSEEKQLYSPRDRIN